MSRLILILFAFLPSCLLAQTKIQLSATSTLGMSYLKTSFQDNWGTGQEWFRYEIFSNPSLVYGFGIEADYQLNKTFSLAYDIKLNRSGYSYRVFDDKNNSINHLRYQRIDVVSDLLIKGFIFTDRPDLPKKKKSKRKKKPAIDKTLHPYILAGYSAAFRLADRYRFEGNDANFLIVKYRSLLHGIRLGGGIQKGRWDYSFRCRVDMRGVLPDFGPSFRMRTFTFSTAHFF